MVFHFLEFRLHILIPNMISGWMMSPWCHLSGMILLLIVVQMYEFQEKSEKLKSGESLFWEQKK